MKVIDIVPGIGSRSIAFMKEGFEIVCAIEQNLDDAKIYHQVVHPQRVILDSVLDVNCDSLPDADIVSGKLQQSTRIVWPKDKDVLQNDLNSVMYNIIQGKRPKFFILEASTYVLNRGNGQATEELLKRYLYLGYHVTYNIFVEKEYSGYPVYGKQLFFVGIREDIYKHEFSFLPPPFAKSLREYPIEDAQTVDWWYRKVSVYDDLNLAEGLLYLRDGRNIRKTEYIKMGVFKETYMVDSIGLRRLTHNELAWLKGFETYDFNQCSNKRKMYNKIASSSSVFIVEAIAKSLIDYLEYKERDTHTDMLAKKKNADQEKVVFPKQKIVNIHINKLKGLENVNIPINKRLTAIMGVNGTGKSTILHALACAYSPYDKGDNYRFSFFFTPNPDSDWKNSSLELSYYDENEQKEITRTYKKDSDRWSPRYVKRPIRDVHFVGIETCIPEIEKEKQTSFIDYFTDALDDASALKIIEKAAYILNKDYQSLTMHHTKKKELLGVQTADALIYSSLSMGAGEQRVLKILRLLYSVNSYSLILIDEIDLLLHVTALRRLVKVLYDVAERKNLQIIFTTHSLEMLHLCEYVDIRYLERIEKKVMVYHEITSDMIYDMTNTVDKPIDIFVEDLLAEVVVKQIAEDLGMLRSIRVRKYGAASNAFVLASGYILKADNISNVLIVLDGDKYTESQDRRKAIEKVLSGTEKEHEEKIQKALLIIRQLVLPEGTAPEKNIYDMLVEMESSNEIVKLAQKHHAVEDSHQWLDELTLRIGQGKEMVLYKIMELVSQHSRWGDYIKEIHDWMLERRLRLNLEMQEI